MRDVLPEILEGFTKQGWHYQIDQDDPQNFFMNFNDENARWNCNGWIENGLFTFVVFFQNRIPDDQIPVVLEMVARLNNLFSIGSLQVDVESKLISYHVACPIVTENDFSDMAVELVRWALGSADSSYKPLMKVMFGNLTPEQVIEEIYAASSEKEQDTTGTEQTKTLN